MKNFPVKSLTLIVAVIILLIVPMLFPLNHLKPEKDSLSHTLKEPSTIKVWHIWSINGDSQRMSIEWATKSIMQKHPDINIEMDAIDNEQYKPLLRTAMAANELPDVFLTWSYGFSKPFVKSGRMLDLTNYLVKDGYLNNVAKGALDHGKYDGRYYIVVGDVQEAVVYYSTAIFKRYGLKKPSTMQDLKNIITVLASHGVTPFALGGKDKWPILMWYSYLLDRTGGNQMFMDAVNHQTQFNNPSFIKAGETLQELAKLGCFGEGYTEKSNLDAVHDFQIGEAAMLLTGNWEIPSIEKSTAGGEVDLFEFPTLGNRVSNSWIGGGSIGFAVNARTSHKDKAVTVCKELPRGKQAYEAANGIIPMSIYKDIVVDKEKMTPLTQSLAGLLSRSESFTCWFDVVLEPIEAEQIKGMVQDIAALSKTPEEACTEFEEFMNRRK